MDSFYIGNLKGVGKVYQLTAIDVATRWAIMLIVIGPVNAGHTIRFIDHVIKTFRASRRVGAGRAHRQRTGVDRRRVPRPPRRPAASPIIGSRRARRTTTRCANASRGPHYRSAGGPPSTAAASPASASCKPKPTPGSCATTTAAATTVTTCADAPRPRSSTNSSAVRHHDQQPQGPPPVTSTSGREGLERTSPQWFGSSTTHHESIPMELFSTSTALRTSALTRTPTASAVPYDWRRGD